MAKPPALLCDTRWDGHVWRAFDLPAYWQSAGNLEDNLNSWPSENSGRAKRRHRPFGQRPDIPFLGNNGYCDRDLPFASLIAFDELGHFGKCNGLKARLRHVLLDWVEAQDHWWNFWTDDEMLGATLRQVILLNKRQTGILIDGQPPGQRAFALLTTRYPETEAATATKHWYHTDRNCRG